MNHSSQYTLHDVWVVGQPGWAAGLRGDRGACVCDCVRAASALYKVCVQRACAALCPGVSQCAAFLFGVAGCTCGLHLKFHGVSALK